MSTVGAAALTQFRSRLANPVPDKPAPNMHFQSEVRKLMSRSQAPFSSSNEYHSWLVRSFENDCTQQRQVLRPRQLVAGTSAQPSTRKQRCHPQTQHAHDVTPHPHRKLNGGSKFR
jgi:hypothetical protein